MEKKKKGKGKHWSTHKKDIKAPSLFKSYVMSSCCTRVTPLPNERNTWHDFLCLSETQIEGSQSLKSTIDLSLCWFLFWWLGAQVDTGCQPWKITLGLPLQEAQKSFGSPLFSLECHTISWWQWVAINIAVTFLCHCLNVRLAILLIAILLKQVVTRLVSLVKLLPPIVWSQRGQVSLQGGRWGSSAFHINL